MVRDLLQGFVDEEWVEKLDFTTLEKVSGSYVTDDLRDREDDVIWRVRWSDRWLYIYALLEFQSTVDRFMAVRMLVYVGLLYQDLIKSGQIGQGDELPPVLPVILYNGKPEWTASKNLADLIATVPGGLGRYKPQMEYMLIDEVRYADADLVSMRNLTAALFRLEKSTSPEQIRDVLSNLIEWLKAPEQLSLRRSFTVMLGRVLLPRKAPGQSIPELNDLHEVDAMLAETVQEWTKEWKAEGLQEGLQAGLQKGESQLLLRQLRHQFGDLPEWAESKVSNANIDKLEEWGDKIFDAETLDSVFK
uniref:Putative transposase n=1 Tax=Magnetococcus massalia (strain MO-1) TaxID=451514 RepID=A0A1S7LCR4_MAGMO|nr:Putative transposase [Candidatus Magnetococcus massalia]